MAQVVVEKVLAGRRRMNHVYCDSVGVPPSTMYRWKRRMAAGLLPLNVPGPKKLVSVNIDEFKRDIEALQHGNKRSDNTGKLHKKYAEAVSRRDIDMMVELTRARLRNERRNSIRQVIWNTCNIVWAMDDTHVGYDEYGQKLYLHNVYETASRYVFKPLSGYEPSGEEVAANLETMFTMYGAPLFLKMDLGTNFNDSHVLELLLRYQVIPLFSPPAYPQYNGGIERHQGLLKQRLFDKFVGKPNGAEEHLQVYGEVAAHDLNHWPREVLKGKYACDVFSARRQENRLNARERRATYDWIMEQVESILLSMENGNERNEQKVHAAIRSAAEAWLVKNGHLTIIGS